DFPVAVRDAVRAAAEATLLPQAGVLSIVNPAQLPTVKSSPNKKLTIVLFVLAGAVIAIVFGVVRDSIRDRIDTEERLAELAPFPSSCPSSASESGGVGRSPRRCGVRLSAIGSACWRRRSGSSAP